MEWRNVAKSIDQFANRKLLVNALFLITKLTLICLTIITKEKVEKENDGCMRYQHLI